MLITKLFVPPVRPGLVERSRLTERLNAGLHRKLTLVSVPAGFGKTTLISKWVANSRRPVAWISLDQNDNDASRFLSYFVAALQTIEPDIGKGVSSALQSPQPPPVEVLLTSVINEIAATSDRIIIVLDDYHLIEAKPIHDALTFLLTHLPPQMHLVIATREDPYLPLARLRARGQLTEPRATDLRFTTSEAAGFLHQTMGLNLSSEDIAALETRTEGWIAGLQLAAISMQEHKDVTGFIKSFAGSHRLVLDYLIEEVLEQQPADIQVFLLQTAILGRLAGSLCDALTGQDNGRATLEYLERANLFIVPLDEERHWCRYHHLFADLLRQRLRQNHQDQIPGLHRRASEWYEQEDLPSEAIRHAMAAEDHGRAAELAELAWPAWSETYRSLAWLDWVKELPEELVHARPVLSMAYAFALLSAGRLEDAEIKLTVVEQWLGSAADTSGRSQISPSEMIVVDEEQFRALPISIASARAYHTLAIGDVRSTEKYVERVLDLLPDDDHYTRGATIGLLGLAYWASGDLEAAHRTFSEGVFQDVHDQITGIFVVADMKLTLGRLGEAISLSEHALRLAAEYDEPNPLGTEDVYTAISDLHRNRVIWKPLHRTWPLPGSWVSKSSCRTGNTTGALLKPG